ncbi:MAG: hypothetical protein ACTS6J_13185, partial [Burkholderiales bacterium]
PGGVSVNGTWHAGSGKPLSFGRGFLFFLAARRARPPSVCLPQVFPAQARLRRVSKKHLTNLILNCKNAHYRPVYK